jgi:hypothetical protein
VRRVWNLEFGICKIGISPLEFGICKIGIFTL